ncbi:DUF3313 domain-containing protein [Pseudomonas sp. NPDC098747]|uniref:DUF3313 domain-containing protein n=1 Tax=Pseudomonas sp. NPDC098747 TaxID=3364487 RepID=UPI00383B2AC5
MNSKTFTLCAVLLGSTVLTGCVSKITTEEQFSGYLNGYHGLEKTKSATGEPVLRWVVSGFNPDDYSTIVFDELELFPAPKPTERVNLETLEDLRAITNANLVHVLEQKYKVIPGSKAVSGAPRTLVLHAAITGVSASPQGLHWYEILPVGAVVGAVAAVTGKRDQDTELFIEADLVDASTGYPVAKVVRKVIGSELENNKQKITTKDFKLALKGLTSDLSQFINQ